MSAKEPNVTSKANHYLSSLSSLSLSLRWLTRKLPVFFAQYYDDRTAQAPGFLLVRMLSHSCLTATRSTLFIWADGCNTPMPFTMPTHVLLAASLLYPTAISLLPTMLQATHYSVIRRHLLLTITEPFPKGCLSSHAVRRPLSPAQRELQVIFLYLYSTNPSLLIPSFI